MPGPHYKTLAILTDSVSVQVPRGNDRQIIYLFVYVFIWIVPLVIISLTHLHYGHEWVANQWLLHSNLSGFLKNKYNMTVQLYRHWLSAFRLTKWYYKYQTC